MRILRNRSLSLGAKQVYEGIIDWQLVLAGISSLETVGWVQPTIDGHEYIWWVSLCYTHPTAAVIANEVKQSLPL
jgi:hypothetical protein